MLGWVGRQLGLVPEAAEKLSGDGVVQFPVNLQSQPQLEVPQEMQQIPGPG